MSENSPYFVTLETENLPGPGPQTITIQENHQSWSELIDLVEELGIVHWHKEYFAPGIMDGRSWSLNVRVPGCRRKITGLNAYPDRFEELEAWMEANAR